MCELYFEINKRTKAMDKLKKIFLLAFLQFIAVFASAQGIDYLKKANEAYINGNYNYAVTMYKMYYAETGSDISALQKQAEQCRDYLKSGDDAAIAKDYATARHNYQLVLNLNPEDLSTKSKLASLQNTLSVPSGLKVGDEYLGGTVAHIDNTGRHGFIINSISKYPIEDEISHKKALDSCPEGLRLPSLNELKLMAQHINVLPLYDDVDYYVCDENITFFIMKEHGNYLRYKVLSRYKTRGYAIYIKDF